MADGLSAAAPAYRLLTAMTCVALALAAVLGFAWQGEDLPVMVAMLATMLVLAALLRLTRGFRAGVMLEAWALIMAATMATACLSVLFATSAFPYQDVLLVNIDRWLVPGFSWMDMFALLHRHDRLVAAMTAIYTSLLWQPFMLIAALALMGQSSECRRFTHGWVVALTICVVLFPFVPALSAFPFYGIHDTTIPAMTVHVGWRQFEVLEAIRHHLIHRLDPGEMTGMISYPSFHAAGATLLFWGFRRVPVIGPIFMLADVAMALTAPLIGSHYFVDILAGVVTGIIAIRVAARDQ